MKPFRQREMADGVAGEVPLPSRWPDRALHALRRRRAAMALAVSFVLHLAMLNRLPAMRLGSPMSPRRPQPIAVRLVPPPPEPWPSRSPAALAQNEEGSAGDLRQEMTPPPLPAPEYSAASLEPKISREAPATEPWVPRLERLETEFRRVPDALAALPRRLDIAVPRRRQAPDIVPPLFQPTMPDAFRLPSAEAMANGHSGEWFVFRRGSSGRTPSGAEADIHRILDSLVSPSVSPRQITGAEPIEALLDIQLRAHALRSDPSHRYFEIRIAARPNAALPAMPKDVLLVQDCSESMTQPILDECKRGLMAFLATLRPEDRFDLVAFAETRERCFHAMVPADVANRARAGWFIERLVSRGKTDVLAFLGDVEAMRLEPGRAGLVVLVSDGIPTVGLMDHFVLIERFSERNPAGLSVFTFGAGPRLNRFLLDLLSYRNRGDSRLIPERRRIAMELSALGAELAHPVLTEVRYGLAGEAGRQVYPRVLMNLYQDRPLVLYGRVRADARPSALHIRGQSARGAMDLVFPLQWESAEPAGPEIVSEWARQRMYALLAEYVRTRDLGVREEWARVGRAYGIPLPYGDALDLPTSPVPLHERNRVPSSERSR